MTKNTIEFTSLSKYDRERVNGSSLIDYVECTYNHLVACLGEPMIKIVDNKTTSEWHVDVSVNHETQGVITVYDYKEQSPPKHAPDQPVTWHVGGKCRHTANHLINFIKPNNS